MASASFADSVFSIGYCATCAKDVLTHVDLGPANEEIRRCLHCDALITRLRLVSSEELQAHGYALIEARVCGNGGGCSVSGCGPRRGT